MPDFTLVNQHKGWVAGIDEAGRGPLAGPVVAACVFIGAADKAAPFWSGIQDSKKLSLIRREALYTHITQTLSYGVGVVDAPRIDEINILQATMEAMGLAYQQASIQADQRASMVLIDGNRVPSDLYHVPAQAVVKGDDRCLAIAAASIVAKVTRDRIMRSLHQAYPAYCWAQNAGYGTKAHKQALQEFGPTPHHRRSFKPVRDCLKGPRIVSTG